MLRTTYRKVSVTLRTVYCEAFLHNIYVRRNASARRYCLYAKTNYRYCIIYLCPTKYIPHCSHNHQSLPCRDVLDVYRLELLVQPAIYHLQKPLLTVYNSVPSPDTMKALRLYSWEYMGLLSFSSSWAVREFQGREDRGIILVGGQIIILCVL